MTGLDHQDSGSNDGSRDLVISKGTQENGVRYILNLNDKKLPNIIGNKAKNLKLLREKHFRIPETHVCTWDAYSAFQQNGSAFSDQLKSELENLLKPGQAYAIRSSANIEDGLAYSFAGQFETYLNVSGVDQVFQAICSIWDSAQSESAQSYMNRLFGGEEPLKMAVIIQDMVNPIFSGVSFSKNPVTGLNEIVIEAVQGSGISLVQSGVTPFRWVYKWGKWITQPDEPGIPQKIINEVADQTMKIAKVFKKDVDLEWVYDGENLYWLQLRDITTLGNINIYSNRISKEMSPGMIKPLVWSVKIPIPTSIWIGFFKEVVGKIDIDPADLTHAFYYRAYFNIGVFGKIFDNLGMPRESLDIMMGVAPPGTGKPKYMPNPKMMLRLPQLMGFLWDKWNFGKRAEADYPHIQAAAQQYPLYPSLDLTERQLLSTIDELIVLNRKSTYDTILSILLMQLYNRLLKSRLESLGIDFQQFDLTDDMPEIREYDPNSWLESLNLIFKQLDPGVQEQIRNSDYEAFLRLPGIDPLQKGIAQFLEKHGHLSDIGTDFSLAPWRETPDVILRVITDFHLRTEQPKTKVRFQELQVKGIQRLFLSMLYNRARQFRLLREKHSSLYTYTLMLFRVYYLALGDRLVRRGLLKDQEDVFYLYDNEIRTFLVGQESGELFPELVTERKAEMEQYKDIVLPEVIYGDVPPPILNESIDKLMGIPTSKGYYTGKIKVIRSIGEFPKLNHGDVLVIPYSDVGWTPLFAKAGAVIAESGGVLSHSSIIAREYNIPAVVSVAGALNLNDNAMVTIDGYKGEIMVHTW